MEKQFGSGTVELIQGDITKLKVHAITTAANSGLRGGGGVDGAVHRAAGRGLLEACRAVGSCPTGSAVATEAFELAANGVRNVIHAVGPIWHGGTGGESAQLEGAYSQSLKLADENGCESIAFPSISTGVYGFPIDQAALIAVAASKKFLESHPANLKRIVFALFDKQTFSEFERALRAL